MTGKLLAGGIVLFALIFGIGVYYTQVYAYYERVSDTAPQAHVMLTSVVSGAPEEVIADGFEGIDAESSPIRFRACFTTPMSLAMLSETYVIHDDPVPLIAPGWFDCFDAKTIGAALESGEALGFLGQENITYGVDRVVAVFPDGRGYAWNQLNHCGEVVFDGKPAPEGCPPAPENY
ncbi:DUF6446 family protein [Actibacterium ureilyticum]|uniref:DUF6446 family protein n=1 Tax=Actibacterium ureilyticum TaxID=1590614 RepID=UPI001FEA79D5|nr:DUF6446 family protein [Actibacterium ureilyticum]